MPDAHDARALPARRPDLAVAPGDLRLSCGAACFDFATTSDVPADGGLVGQERALEALELGLALRRQGYHVFVAGASGTGRTTALEGALARIAPTLPVPPDRAFVHRFDDPDAPRLLTLPPGTAKNLARELDELRRTLAQRVPTLLEDQAFERRREEVGRRYAKEEEAAFAPLKAALDEDGLAVVGVEAGGAMRPEIVAIRAGKPAPIDSLEGHEPAEMVAMLRERAEVHGAALREHMRTSRDRQRAFAREVRAMVEELAGQLLDEELREARAVTDDDATRAFLDEVRADATRFVVELLELGPPALERFGARLNLYRLNVVADRSDLAGAPVVLENFPTRQNLVGSVERVQEGQFAWRADATTIRGGSLLRADGGYLVVQAQDLLTEPGAWDGLKRTIKNGLLELGGASGGLLGLPRTLEPDAVPVDVKVVLVGERQVHDLLYRADPDFQKLFGVRAEFAADMERTAAAMHRYADVIAAVCARDALPPLTAEACGAIVEEGAALAGRRDRLTTRFSEIANLVREAAFWAGRRGATAVDRPDVEEAVRRRGRRDGLIEERLQAMLEEGSILVTTAGRAVGRVNGLSVYDLGYHAFGKPTRITVAASPGRAGIINIEREAQLSGSIYDKGVLIISGFLRRRYADTGPLTLTASLAFEQSYAGVDGDSASIAEVAALLSELSGIAADQALAITGSINQHGEVQPVGGVTHKLTGFWELCRARGLDGTHGAIVPHQNVRDLMLPPEDSSPTSRRAASTSSRSITSSRRSRSRSTRPSPRSTRACAPRSTHSASSSARRPAAATCRRRTPRSPRRRRRSRPRSRASSWPTRTTSSRAGPTGRASCLRPTSAAPRSRRRQRSRSSAPSRRPRPPTRRRRRAERRPATRCGPCGSRCSPRARSPC